jgi:hypothetical protein
VQSTKSIEWYGLDLGPIASSSSFGNPTIATGIFLVDRLSYPWCATAEIHGIRMDYYHNNKFSSPPPGTATSPYNQFTDRIMIPVLSLCHKVIFHHKNCQTSHKSDDSCRSCKKLRLVTVSVSNDRRNPKSIDVRVTQPKLAVRRGVL